MDERTYKLPAYSNDADEHEGDGWGIPRPLLAVLLIVALLVLVVAFNVAIDLSMGCTTARN